MMPQAFLLFLLATFLGILPIRGQDGVLSLGQATLDSHAQMESALERLRQTEILTNPYFGNARIVELERYLTSITFKGNEEVYVRASMRLAVSKAEQGELENAIRILRFCKKWADSQNATGEKPSIITLTLGQVYLRLAETRNCCARYSPQSCILPLEGGAIHRDQMGSRKAIAAAEEVLQKTTNQQLRTNAMWLLNLAHMTLGQYPDSVPEEFRIPERFFQSSHPFPRFPNRAQELGLDLDSMAGGVVADDFDGDHDIDLVISNWNPGSPLRYFENRGSEGFRERTIEAGISKLYGGLNLVQADYDNDGDNDILVLRGGWIFQSEHPNSLLRNEGNGTFRDVTLESGLADQSHATQTAAWADYDLDGDLDLYVGNESRHNHAAPCQLYQNQGDGTFIDLARTAGVENLRFTKGVAWGDINGDSLPDLVVSNYRHPNRLYLNLGNGRFQDVAKDAGVENPNESFPVWVWDFNNDGNLDIFISSYCFSARFNLVHQAFDNALDANSELAGVFVGNGKGTFTNRASQMGLDQPLLTMGSNFGDLNNDGFPDFYLGTGDSSFQSIMPNSLYLNLEGTRFEDVSMAAGMAHLQKGHAVAFADFDHDGDLDVFEQLGGASYVDSYRDAYFENPGFPNTNWIKLKLVGVVSNRSAIGARIKLTLRETGMERVVYQHVSSGGSFGSNPLCQHIGLGSAPQIDQLEVFWPRTGKTQIFRDLAPNRLLEITEGSDQIVPIDLPPVRFAQP